MDEVKAIGGPVGSETDTETRMEEVLFLPPSASMRASISQRRTWPLNSFYCLHLSLLRWIRGGK